MRSMVKLADFTLLVQGDHGDWNSWKSSNLLNGARKPVLFSDRETGKAGISTFDVPTSKAYIS